MERRIRKILTLVICQKLKLDFRRNNTEALVIWKKTQVPSECGLSRYKFYSAVYNTFREI